MPGDPEGISHTKLLVGEGVDEVRFFNSLLKTDLDIDDVQVVQSGGKSKLAEYLRLLPLRPSFSGVISLCVTRDADANVADTFRSVREALTRAGLSSPAINGSIAEGPPRVGVPILPGGDRPGMLEDLCLAAVHDDPIMSCLDEYFSCMQRVNHPLPANMAKARVHAWLASRQKPDLRLGEAAEKGYWSWTAPAFDPLKQFLRALFSAG